MKWVLFLCFSVMFFLLQGCSPIGKTEFIKDADAFSHKETVDLPQFTEIADPDKNFEQYLRTVLQDPTMQNAIYDEAFRSKSWRSSEKILQSEWHHKFMVRGLGSSDSRDHELFLDLLAEYVGTMNVKQCAAFDIANFEVDQVFGFGISRSKNKIYQQLAVRVLKRGAVTEVKKYDIKLDEAIVAVVAFISKAKETIPDKELGEMLLRLGGFKKYTVYTECDANKQAIKVLQSLEPKYRDALFYYEFKPQM